MPDVGLEPLFPKLFTFGPDKSSHLRENAGKKRGEKFNGASAEEGRTGMMGEDEEEIRRKKGKMRRKKREDEEEAGGR